CRGPRCDSRSGRWCVLGDADYDWEIEHSDVRLWPERHSAVSADQVNTDKCVAVRKWQATQTSERRHPRRRRRPNPRVIWRTIREDAAPGRIGGGRPHTQFKMAKGFGS